MGKGGSTTTVQKADPWKVQQPYLERAFQEAWNLYSGYNPIIGYDYSTPGFQGTSNKSGVSSIYGFPVGGGSGKTGTGEPQAAPVYGDKVGGKLEYYPGQMVADLSGLERQGLGILENLNPGLQRQFDEYAANVLSGDYENPYIRKMYQMAWDDVRGSLGSQASQYGAYGGSDYFNLLGETSSDLATQLYGNAYNQDLSRAMAWIPTSQGMDIGRAQAQLAGGALERQIEQAKIDAELEKWNFEQMEPWTRLQLLMGITGGKDWGGTTTQSVNMPGSTLGGLLGGGLAGAGLAGSLMSAGALNSWSPWGWGLMGLGALGGLLG